MITLFRVFSVCVAVFLATGCGHLVYSSGPYRGSVIDADSKQPLVGAVVLAIWYREVPVAPHGPAVDYHDALEVLTDAQGEFAVPAKTHLTPIGKIREPAFVIYAPGYGYYDGFQVHPVGKEIAAAYEQKYFHVELRKWKTRDELIRNADYPAGVDHRIPKPKKANLIRLINVERQRLELQPIGGGGS